MSIVYKTPAAVLKAFTETYVRMGVASDLQSADAALLADFVTSLETFGMITAEVAAEVTAPTPQAFRDRLRACRAPWTPCE